MMSHNVQPLLFFTETKLMNLVTELNVISPGRISSIQNNCSAPKATFFSSLLTNIQHTQRVINRVLSLPAFSNLLECDSYLRRYYTYTTGLPSRMVCPRTYQPSLADCKAWALHACKHLTTHEKMFLTSSMRRHRRSWMCHAGLFGLFRKIYESTGHTCEPNHFENLLASLKLIADTLRVSRSLTRTINGKLVYVIKTTDSLTTKVNRLSSDARLMEATFTDWQDKLNRFAAGTKCHDGLLFEFLSKHSWAVNQAFASFLRLTEIQDILHQLAGLTKKALFGYSMLPRFLDTEIHAKLASDQSLLYTVKALQDGFPILINPMVDIEHHGQHITARLLLTIPVLPNLAAFCTIEYLSPLKFNLSNTCYTGPVTATNFALVSCPTSKQLVTTEMLQQCYKDSSTIICPQHILNFATNISWLGFPFNPDVKLTFPRNHVRAHDCSNLHPLVHLGGRSYLSTTTAPLTLSSGQLVTTPFTIYHFPCNVSFAGMVTGLGRCPSRISLTVPLFTTYSVQYVPWADATADDMLLQLHHDSLDIPPPTTLNHSVLDELDLTYATLDGEFTTKLAQTDNLIDSIHESITTTTTDAVAYAALSITLLNTVTLVAILCFLRPRPQPGTLTRTSSIQSPTCPTCPRPVSL